MANNLNIELPLETSVIVSQAIAQIYRAARSQSLEKFKTDALEQFNDVIAFDGASWLSFVDRAELNLPMTQQKYSLDEDFWQTYHPLLFNWLRSKDLAGSYALFQPQEIALLPAAKQDVQIQVLLAQYGFYHHLVLTTRYLDMTHVICLFRKQSTMAFDQFELDISQFIVDNLSRAFQFHLERKVQRTTLHCDGCIAVCSAFGQLLCASKDFTRLSEQIAANWQQVLKQQLTPTVSFPIKMQFGHHKIIVNKDESLLNLELYPYDEAIEALTDREFEVLKLMATGIDTKQTAKQLGVKYRTVDNHLSSIHRKLGVSKSSEMVSLMLQSRYLLA